MTNGKLTPEQLFEAAKLASSRQMSEEAQKKAMLDFARSRMSGEQSRQLNDVLGDADAVNRLMKSEQAQKIIKRFLEKK